MNRLDNEIEHGKKIKANAEDVWNWDSPAGRVRADRRAELLCKYGKINSTDKLIEIGCGTGLFTEKVSKISGTSDITAVDISEDLLELAREKNKHFNFVLGDAMNLTYQDNTFDVAFGSSVIHHLDIEKSFKELFRVLKPGGRIVFAEPNMINPQILIQKNVPFIKKWLGDSPDETAIIRWKLAKMLESLNYVKVNIFPYDFLHPITPNFLIGTVNTVGKIIEQIPVLKEIAGSVIIAAEKPNN